jgi:tRNA 2-selenouridine synthase
MRIPANDYHTLHQHTWRWVDLRSPAEFARDHVPSAINVPLFDDQQREIIGTLYKKESPQSAFHTGLAFVEERLPRLLEALFGHPLDSSEWLPRFQDLGVRIGAGADVLELEPYTPSQSLPAEPPLVLYCWRGGMRSRSVAALLKALGLPVVLLEGGYKNYRTWVRAQLAAMVPPNVTVLRGPTGVGKTLILAQLERRRPNTTLCLESLADHRSSVLGAIGKAPVSQPFFDSKLVARLQALDGRPFFVEGESRKVGDVILPEKLWLAMECGRQIQLQATTETRVRNLMDDYLAADGAMEAICAHLPFLEGRIGKKWTGQLEQWLREGRAADVVEVLLERYYDPLYAHSDKRRSWCSTLQVESPSLVEDLFALLDTPNESSSGELPRFR